MSLPNLSWLNAWGPRPAQRARTDGEDDRLPSDMWRVILHLVDTVDDPCVEIVRRCEVNKQWAALCREDDFYDNINRGLGWYGTHANLEEVRAHYEGRLHHLEGAPYLSLIHISEPTRPY